MDELNDSSPMPFGKHKGAKMEDVPASYLLWLWNEGIWREANRPLHHYILGAMSALEKECPDIIVKKSK